MKKGGYVYIVTNKRNGTLYIGVTSDLIKRIHQHKTKVIPGFSSIPTSLSSRGTPNFHLSNKQSPAKNE